MKVVINTRYGGFGLSPKAEKRITELQGKEYVRGQFYEDRSNSILIQVVEELGKEANGRCADLSIIEIPDDVEWQIEEYDGKEWIAEKHRTWN